MFEPDNMEEEGQLPPVCEAALYELEQAGATQDVLEACRTFVCRAADDAARGAMESRAAFLAANLSGFQEPLLPPVEQWHLMLTGRHRALSGLENTARNVLTFTKAMYACMRVRGEDTGHLFRDGVGPDDAGAKVWHITTPGHEQCLSNP